MAISPKQEQTLIKRLYKKLSGKNKRYEYE
jgi:DNA-binding CsgD family transcriptional regulator